MDIWPQRKERCLYIFSRRSNDQRFQIRLYRYSLRGGRQTNATQKLDASISHSKTERELLWTALAWRTVCNARNRTKKKQRSKTHRALCLWRIGIRVAFFYQLLSAKKPLQMFPLLRGYPLTNYSFLFPSFHLWLYIAAFITVPDVSIAMKIFDVGKTKIRCPSGGNFKGALWVCQNYVNGFCIYKIYTDTEWICCGNNGFRSVLIQCVYSSN